MELYKELLAKVFQEEQIVVSFPGLPGDLAKLMETKAYRTLDSIAAAVRDENLNDFDCIERIVHLLEESGIGGGVRHDFG